MPGALLLAWAVAGGLWAASASRPHWGASCPAHQVPLVSTAVHNAMLDIILMSGYVTMGIGTVVGGSVIMTLTWLNVGLVARGFGWSGVAVLLPHGTLEAVCWYWSTSLGMAPLATRIRAWSAGTAEAAVAETDLTGRWVLRRLAMIGLTVGAASVVEVLWTSAVGKHLVC